MKNNKGFSTVELVVSFSICMVVVVILFQIVVSLRELYEKSGIKTELLNKKKIFIQVLPEELRNLFLQAYWSDDFFSAPFKIK